MFFDTIKAIKYHIKVDSSIWFIYPSEFLYEKNKIKYENRLI